jgi:hypothetical protein
LPSVTSNWSSSGKRRRPALGSCSSGLNIGPAPFIQPSSGFNVTPPERGNVIVEISPYRWAHLARDIRARILDLDRKPPRQRSLSRWSKISLRSIGPGNAPRLYRVRDRGVRHTECPRDVRQRCAASNGLTLLVSLLRPARVNASAIDVASLSPEAKRVFQLATDHKQTRGLAFELDAWAS